MSEPKRGLQARACNPLDKWSGRPDSNRRRPAWEAGILPLNYGRACPYSSRPARVVKSTRSPSSTTVTKSGEATAATRRLLALFDRHIVPLDALVAPRLPDHAFGGAVEVELLVQRHGGSVLDPQPVDLVV